MHRRKVFDVRRFAMVRATGGKASGEKPLDMALQSTGLDASFSTNRPPFVSAIREGEHVPPAFLPSAASQETCRAGRDACFMREPVFRGILPAASTEVVMAMIVFARSGLGHFRFSSKRESTPSLYFTAFPDAKPLRTFAGNALAPAGAF